ncbi:uncharacterized protein EAF01_011304 [Botrytis porri]|uniref:Uncharacterized protein n=1 Tax=Botrytis porri TaxID=87229 RepID=A0A4Z1KRC6_9HELO|nr:uncharacterized protein EAF01_011304 [Botrytis porri]KAF7886626.1 hypothetical protein EAF01_011304 [Botrytis porri]TGO84459.1 hypothetical protein BPOR_0502g00020 [Botrytis porri]
MQTGKELNPRPQLHFFDLAIEIRLKIYNELLIASDSSPLEIKSSETSPSYLIPSKRYHLCPAILRSNKQVHLEASPILYSSNKFVLCRLQYFYVPGYKIITGFLDQIGERNALFLRYLDIYFPLFPNSIFGPGQPWPAGRDIQVIGLLIDKFKNLVTLKISPWDNLRFGGGSIRLAVNSSRNSGSIDSFESIGMGLNAFDERFKAMPALKDMMVDFHVSNAWPDDLVDRFLRKKIHGSRWMCQVTREDSLSESDTVGCYFGLFA